MSGSKLTASKIRQGWKKELAKLEFRLEGSLFVRNCGELRQVVGVQRNMLSSTWKINLYITLVDQFRDPPQPVVCLHGNVTSDDARFFEKEGSWWTEEKLPGRLETLLRFGIPWLNDFADPLKLISLFERAIEQCTSLESLVEPRQNQNPEWPKWIKPIYESPATPPRPAPLYFLLLSLLYYAIGDFEKSCSRARIWLEHVSDGKTPGEPERTFRLLTTMRCKHEGPLQ